MAETNFDTTPYVQDSSTGGTKASIKSFFKKMTTGQTFDDKKVPMAYKAFLMSKYGRIADNNKRVDEFMTHICDLITARNDKNKFFITEEIPEDIIEYKEILIDFFRRKGYICIDLAEKLEGLSTSYLFLEWGDFHRCQKACSEIESEKEKIEENLQNS